MRFPFILCCLSLSLADFAHAQNRSALNPEISFIGDARALAGDATPDDLALSFEELEIGATANLNPYSSGAVFLGLHDGEIEIEEAYVEFGALPWNTSLRAGQFLVGAGRYVRQHSHVFSFLDYPLLVTEYHGEEGFSDVGLNPSILLDVGGAALTISANVLAGTAEEHHHDEEAEKGVALPDEGEEARGLEDLAYVGRASLFLPWGDDANLELAGSAGTRKRDEHVEQLFFGGDFKYKWRPDARRSLSISGEILANRLEDEESGAEERGFGAFGVVDFRFRERWNVGALIDFAQHAEDSDEEQLGVGAFGGFALFEESTLLRLLVRHDQMPEGMEDETSVQLQAVFSMGPHQPHQF